MFSCLLLVRLVCAYLVLNLQEGSQMQPICVAILGSSLDIYGHFESSLRPWVPPGGEPGGEAIFKVADLRHQSWTAMRPSTM